MPWKNGCGHPFLLPDRFAENPQLSWQREAVSLLAKFLSANQHKLGQNLCWALKLMLGISFSPLAYQKVSQVQPSHVLPMLTLWLDIVVCT